MLRPDSSIITPTPQFTQNFLNKNDQQILNEIQKANHVDINDHRVSEWVKCRSNPLYFILNYVYLPEIGGKIKYNDKNFHIKLRRVIRIIFRFKLCLFMASRQLGKSSIAAALLVWASIFFPNNRIVILNFQKSAAQENLKKIKFIIKYLPDWMKVKESSRSEIKTYLELDNGSRIDTFYPSSTTPPDTLARSLTIPILYVDELGFIPHIDEIYGSAQPTLSTAREQAKKNGYPYFIFGTSTPNGVEGDGKFFYELWERAIESDNLFDIFENQLLEDWIDDNDLLDILNDPSKNSFIRVKYHWSENENKTQEWYEQQKKELNFDRRKINQELDLLFVGGSNCIFDDETIQKFIYIKWERQVPLANQTKLDLFTNPKKLDRNDFYLIGVDTASSIKGCFNAIEIFSFKHFEQIAEMNVRLGSLTKYGETVHSVFQFLYTFIGQRIILCIENNSIGKATIEHLLYHVPDFDYTPYIYREKDKEGRLKDEFGVSTNTQTKELMVSLLYDNIKESPELIKSQNFISQLSSIQRTNRGTIKSGGYSDMFMAGAFCAYVRKMKHLEILPMLDYSNRQIQQNFFDTIKTAAQMMNTKIINKTMESTFDPTLINITNIPRSVKEDDYLTQQTNLNKKIENDNDWRIYMPIFGDDF